MKIQIPITHVSSRMKRAFILIATLQAFVCTAPEASSQTYTDALAVMKEVDDQFVYVLGKTVCHDYAVMMVMLMDAKWPGSAYIFCAVDGVGFDGAWALKDTVSTSPLPQSENTKTEALTNFNGESKWVKADLGLDEKKITKHAQAHTWVIVRTKDLGLVQFDPTWSDDSSGVTYTSEDVWTDPERGEFTRFLYSTNLEKAAVFATHCKKTKQAPVVVYWPENNRVAIVLTNSLEVALEYWKKSNSGPFVVTNEIPSP